MVRLPVVLTLAMGLAALAVAESGDEGEKAFQALCGNEYKRVLATPDTADDVALATQLLGVAKAPDVEAALFAVLCQRIYELAAKAPGGYPAAIAAMQLLAEKSPEARADSLEKIATIRQRQFDLARRDARAEAGEALVEALLAAADAKESKGSEAEGLLLRRAMGVAASVGLPTKNDIQKQVDRNAFRMRQRKQVAELRKRLEAGPEDAASRKEAVRLCLVDLDDPAEAARFLDESIDESTRKYVPAAAKGVSAAPELACLELGQWYHGLAASAVPMSKPAMLQRAQAYLERFLELHQAADARRLMAENTLATVQEELARFGTASAAPLERNLVLGVRFFRQREGPLLDSRRKPVALVGDYKWADDDAFEKPTQTVEFRKAGATWPNEPAFMLRTGSITTWAKHAGDQMTALVCKGLPGQSGNIDYGVFIQGGKLCSYMGFPATSGIPIMTQAAVPANRWSFIAFSWDEKRMAFWLDGTPVAILPLKVPLKLTDGRLEVGIDTPGDVEYFRGRMAAVHLYNVFLSDKQVKDLMKYEAQFMKMRAPAPGPSSK
jgi:hypothetical protein